MGVISAVVSRIVRILKIAFMESLHYKTYDVCVRVKFVVNVRKKT